jgi:4-hydroxy-tetrahydrodipicolinate synthase
MFQGSMVALVTPMSATGEFDEIQFRSLIETHIAAGTQAIGVIGTTGEAPTITNNERHKIIKMAVESARGRVPIIAGTGTNSTIETIYQTEQSMELGVDACLIVTPYYNRPTQEGLYQHYRAVAEAVSIPILLYNVPNRTGCDLLPETVVRLSRIANIVGIKEATGDLARGRELVSMCDKKFNVISGDDASALAFMLQGGSGVISVTANVVPKLMHDMCAAALSNKVQLAGELNTRLMPLHKALFVEPNPIPVKWAVQQLGLIKEGIRLPLTPLSDQYHVVVKEAMKVSGVI